jgi:hypothetical protein
MAWHALDDALRGLQVSNLAGDDCVESDNVAITHGNIGLRGVCLLGLQSVAYEEAIKFQLAAVELLNAVSAMQFFDAKRTRHGLRF